MPYERKKRILHYIRSGLWTSTHVHRVPVQATLMSAVELQKGVIVPRCQTPQKFDIAYLDWFRHLPRLEVSPALTL
jgi:hypothetical protein